MSLATIRKALVALVGVVLMVLTQVAHYGAGFLPDEWLVIVNGLLAALTVLSTWLVPNDTGIEARPVIPSKRQVAGPEQGEPPHPPHCATPAEQVEGRRVEGDRAGPGVLPRLRRLVVREGDQLGSGAQEHRGTQGGPH